MVTFEVVHEWMAQANLVILFIALGLIGISLYLEKKRKWVWHGNSMMVVMLITVLLVIAHMGPSFVSAVSELSVFNFVALTGVIHGLIGAVTHVLGVWFVWVWAINESSSTNFCAPRKKFMWKILVLWLLSLGLGGLYYILHISFG